MVFECALHLLGPLESGFAIHPACYKREDKILEWREKDTDAGRQFTLQGQNFRTSSTEST